MARKSRKIFENEKQADPLKTILPPAGDDPLLQTAAYGRLSVENAGRDDDESLQTQMDILYRFIGEHPELELAGSYMDNGYSGTNFSRPEFNRLMEDVRTGKIQCIVVKDLSRFGRDYLETGYYLETFLPHLNVRLISVNDQYDSFRKDDQDTLSVPIKNIVNDMYAKDLSRKICAANAARRRRPGTLPNGNAPYGYETNEDRSQYIIDPEAAVIVRTIFQWARMGITGDEIAKRLNLMGVPIPSDHRLIKKGKQSKNRKWAYATVHMILNNPSYAGDVCLGRLRQSLYKSEEVRKTSKDEWTVVRDAHEPLVSRADLAEIENAAAEGNCYTERFRGYNVRAREAFRDQMTGLVYCRECGCRMNYVRVRNDYSVATPEELAKGERSKKNGTGRVEFYVCPPLAGKAKCGGHRISTDLLKLVVMDQLGFQIQSLVDTDRLMKKARERNNGKDPILSAERKLTAARRKLAEEEEKLVRLYEDVAEGKLEVEEYQSLREALLKNKEKLAEECSRLQKTADRQRHLTERLSELAESLRGADAGSGFNEELVKETVGKIIVDADGNIEIRFLFQDVIEQITELMKGAEDI